MTYEGGDAWQALVICLVAVALVAGTLVIVSRRQIDQAVQYALRRTAAQREAISQVSQAEELLSGEIEPLARTITELAARTVGSERANLWLFDESETVLRCVDLYEATPHRHSAGLVLEESRFPNGFGAFKVGKYVAADDPLSDPRTARYADACLAPRGITSLLATAIQMSGKNLGLLCLAHVGRAHHWEQDEISFASQLSDKFAIALVSRMRRQAEAAVRESEARFRTIFNSVSDAVFTHDLETGRFLDVNERAVEMLGYSREEMLAGDVGAISVGERPYTQADALERIAAARVVDAAPFEWHLKRKDGQRFWGEVTLRRASLGTTEVMLATVRDITERKRAGDALAKSRRILEGILNTIPVRVFWKDRNFLYLGCNQAFARDAGFSSPDDVLGKDDRQMGWRDQAEAHRADDRQVIETGRPKLLFEHSLSTPDGRTMSVLATKVPLRGPDGEIEGVLGTYVDVSERKHAEEAVRRSEAELGEAQRLAGLGSWTWDPREDLVTWSEELYRIVGRDPALPAPGIGEQATLFTPESYAILTAALEQTLQKGIPYAVDLEFVRPDGGKGWILARGEAERDAQGNLLRARGTALDITERKQAEEKLRIAQEALAEAQAVGQVGSWHLNLADNVLTWSDETYRIFDVDRASFAPTYELFLARIHPGDRAIVDRSYKESVDRHALYVVDHRVVLGDGTVRFVHLRGQTFYGDDGAPVRTTGTVQDITDLKRAEQQISRMVRYDLLTGLTNRGMFVEAVQQAIARTRRGGSNFAVLYLDLDHFKDVNDTLGHPIGDQLLQAVARRLRSVVRETDTVGRFGGDEFAIIQSDLRKPEDAATLADKLLRIVSEPFSIGENDIRTGTSIGIAVFGADTPDAETLLSHADVALYRAKSEGRGIYRFFTESMDAEVRARVKTSGELRAALQSGQLFLVYQPQVDVETGAIVGIEALVRWRHPERGVVGPSEFIPIAETSGLIVALGQWVMREACRQAKAWLEAGLELPLIAVNVSALQFKTPLELERDIGAVLSETGLPAEKLELELTETVLMEASREHNDVLLRLRWTGVRVAIDDFGTGYSSLDYLRRFPVDRIKIAQIFIADLSETSGGAPIVKAAIGLARELSLPVVVEGVETGRQLSLVRSWGAQQVQGFYFAKPLAAEDAASLLEAGKVRLPAGDSSPSPPAAFV